MKKTVIIIIMAVIAITVMTLKVFPRTACLIVNWIPACSPRGEAGAGMTERSAGTAGNQKAPLQDQQDDIPRIVSTIPDPLNETIIPASQVIEITFNKPLQNVPEFKVRIEPKVDFKVELSFDRKTAKITPVKPLGLGTAYTLTINPDTKFDGVGNWGQTKDFHFRTIKYRGI